MTDFELEGSKPQVLMCDAKQPLAQARVYFSPFHPLTLPSIRLSPHICTMSHMCIFALEEYRELVWQEGISARDACRAVDFRRLLAVEVGRHG